MKNEIKKDWGFLGSDVSKGYGDFVLLNSQGDVLEPTFQLDDNREGHKTLVRELEEFKRRFGLKKIIVGLESTGGYERNWLLKLRGLQKKLNLEVYRINPKKIYFESKSRGVQSTDDGVSAKSIAMFCLKNYGIGSLTATKTKHDPNDEFYGMGTLFNVIKMLVGQNVKAKNLLEKLLYQYYPELLSLKGDTYSKWFLTLLSKFPTKNKLQSAGIKQLTKIPFVTEKKAALIMKEIKGTVAPHHDPMVEIAIVQLVNQISQNEELLKINRQLLVDAIKKSDLSYGLEIIKSINGIAEDTAAILLLEIGDITRFETGKNLAAFWGLNPTIKVSGDKRSRTSMSKDGSPRVRATLYNAALNVVKYEPYFKAIFEKFKSRGMNNMQARGVIMAKLARVIFGMLKNKKEFDAGVDVENQENRKVRAKKAKKSSKQLETESKRRFQNHGQSAPISSWQKKNRKKKQKPVALS